MTIPLAQISRATQIKQELDKQPSDYLVTDLQSYGVGSNVTCKMSRNQMITRLLRLKLARENTV